MNTRTMTADIRTGALRDAWLKAALIADWQAWSAAVLLFTLALFAPGDNAVRFCSALAGAAALAVHQAAQHFSLRYLEWSLRQVVCEEGKGTAEADKELLECTLRVDALSGRITALRLVGAVLTLMALSLLAAGAFA